MAALLYIRLWAYDRFHNAFSSAGYKSLSHRNALTPIHCICIDWHITRFRHLYVLNLELVAWFSCYAILSFMALHCTSIYQIFDTHVATWNTFFCTIETLTIHVLLSSPDVSSRIGYNYSINTRQISLVVKSNLNLQALSKSQMVSFCDYNRMIVGGIALQLQ